MYQTEAPRGEASVHQVRNGGINPQELIPLVINGDIQAFTRLDEYLRPRIGGFISRRISSNGAIAVEDLAQDTMIAALQGLTRFHSTEHSHYNLQFYRWCFGIARRMLFQEYKRRANEGEVVIGVGSLSAPQPEPKIPERELEELIPKFRERLAEILSPAEFEVVQMRMDGKTKDEVIESFELTPKAYSKRMEGARAKYEEQLVLPAGFAPIPDHRFLEAARRGSFTAARFIGRYYAPEDSLPRYKHRMRKLSKVGSPSEDYKRLGELARGEEYRVLLVAVQSGVIPAVRSGRYWFVKKSDYKQPP